MVKILRYRPNFAEHVTAFQKLFWELIWALIHKVLVGVGPRALPDSQLKSAQKNSSKTLYCPTHLSVPAPLFLLFPLLLNQCQ